MLSIPHMIIIFIVALVFFGPEKLPELARNMGKIMAEFKRATGDFKSTFEDHLRELERETDQRRISGPAPVATTAVAALPPATTELGTATVPPNPVAGAVPHPAPWEAAADTAADAMNISPEPPEFMEPPELTESIKPSAEQSSHATESKPESASEDAPENLSERALENPSTSSDPQEMPREESEATPESPIHDDLLA
jgi:TatA/E family protein of Tat protein translocase